MADAFIKHISFYLPPDTLSNDELAILFPEWNAEKVNAKIGINSRHIANTETATDMAIKAAKNLFNESGISPDNIDFILFCTQSPDYFLPTSACLIQKALDIPTSAGALDFNLGCSGYVYGLSLAKGLVMAGVAKNILLITSETYSKYIHPQDKGNMSIFGDGASASLISDNGIALIGDFVLGSDGEGASNLIVKTGASRFPKPANEINFDENGHINASDYLYMNGPEILTFTLNRIPQLLKETVAKNNLDADDINMYVLHQANKFILNTLRKVCGIKKENFYIDLEESGNTVSSTIPIALALSIKDQSISNGMNVIIAGFGVGYSWGATLLKF